MIVRYGKNPNGKDYVCGDIHGCFSSLLRELNSLGFDYENDRLFATGDLVDRGVESHLAEDFLEYPWFKSVMGNHEHLAIQFAEGLIPAVYYIETGGVWNVFNSKEEINRIADTFKKLPIGIELETDLGILGIVHADVPFNDWISFKENLSDAGVVENALWRRARINAIEQFGSAVDIKGIDAVVFGHTTVSEPLFYKNSAYIDTGSGYVGGNNRLTILPVEKVMLECLTL